MIELKAFSHSGKDKDNEDYALCHRLSGNSLVAVLADGMGGLSYGACAAKDSGMFAGRRIAYGIRCRRLCHIQEMQGIKVQDGSRSDRGLGHG